MNVLLSHLEHRKHPVRDASVHSIRRSWTSFSIRCQNQITPGGLRRKTNADLGDFPCFLGRIRTRWLWASHRTRPVTSLGHQGWPRVFWEGPKFCELCPKVFNCAQHIFQGRRKIL